MYMHNCQQEDIQVAASCLCLKTGNIATLTSRMWTAVSARCKPDASEEFSSGLQALTLYCASAMNPGAQATVTKTAKPTTPGTYTRLHPNTPKILRINEYIVNHLSVAATIAITTGTAVLGNIDLIDDDDDDDEEDEDDAEPATTTRITQRPTASPNGSLRNFGGNYITVVEIFVLSFSLLVLYIY